MSIILIVAGTVLSIVAIASLCFGIYLRKDRKSSSYQSSNHISAAIGGAIDGLVGSIEFLLFSCSILTFVLALHCFGIW